ncbi:related to RTT109-regulator of Ty1 transposition [Rhynchosporium secalis]|uniref:histone acetyltransferase n=1 Tax=Rhynchosporium secalis TaxID=38038 RepID=A0A1E1M259_RHYSE|nr:related to RTT109-regulator of Ty1 transposition [Rhynchosporium secalis]
MAAHERTNKASIVPILLQQLAIALPKDAKFKIYHLSTPPTKTSSIYSAPSGTRPDRTYCKSHFLTVSIVVPDDREVLVYAVEILIYSTAHDSTFFVSKADSTGYLHLLGLPKGTPSPIRDITATFLRYLVEQHQRENILSVVSLFARAQDQYLFPGSVEYSGKHVLDDRGLVKWWCRVLDPLIEITSEWESVKGYLTVPGLDSHDTISYVPSRNTSKWTIGHPLREISRHADDVPPRCFIPHYPDDPKARFLDELDEEITKSQNTSDEWKSVKSIEQFWDMMAFRQECSAGRLVGFIWIVFTPKNQQQQPRPILEDDQSSFVTFSSQTEVNVSPSQAYLITPATSFCATKATQALDPQTRNGDSQESRRKCYTPKQRQKKLSGPIIPRQPRIKTEAKNYLLDRPETSAYYIWRPEGRGQIVVDESDYKRVTELLLRLDFANLELATSSSTRWINEVRSGVWGSTGDAWGQPVTGTKAFEIRAASGAAGATTLNVGLMRKKRKDIPDPQSQSTPQVNVLSTGMVRKKAKV